MDGPALRFKGRLFTVTFFPLSASGDLWYDAAGFVLIFKPLVEFMYPVLTCMPGRGTIGDSGLCYCVPCQFSTLTSLYLFLVFKSKVSRPERLISSETKTTCGSLTSLQQQRGQTE